MTELDKLKELAQATVMEQKAAEFSDAMLLLMIVENISPFTSIRAFQMSLCEVVGLAMAHRPDDKFEQLLDGLLGSIKAHCVRIRKREMERRAK